MDLIGSVKDFSGFVYDKAKSPFFWVLLVCFSLNHWNDLLVLFFADDNIHEKIVYIRHSIDNSKIYFGYREHPFFYVLNPLISALLVSLCYPLITVFSALVSDFAITLRNHISHSFNSQKFLSKDVSNEIREEREVLFKTFDRQINESRKQLRDNQNQFLRSQINCSVLFCALGFSQGNESLLPYTDLAKSFPAVNPQQRDLLRAIYISIPNNKTATIAVKSVITAIPSFTYLTNIQNLPEHQLLSIFRDLVNQGALKAIYERKSNSAANMNFDSKIQFTQIGIKFVEITNNIIDGSLGAALSTSKENSH